MNKFCNCFNGVPSPGVMWKIVKDEVVEWKEEPSWDEFSDVCFSFGRFLGTLVGRNWFTFPGSRAARDKVLGRINESGCFRSINHKGCRV